MKRRAALVRRTARRGDVVILSPDRPMTAAQMARIREACEPIADKTGVRFVVIDSGINVEVVRGRTGSVRRR